MPIKGIGLGCFLSQRKLVAWSYEQILRCEIAISAEFITVYFKSIKGNSLYEFIYYYLLKSKRVALTTIVKTNIYILNGMAPNPFVSCMWMEFKNNRLKKILLFICEKSKYLPDSEIPWCASILTDSRVLLCRFVHSVTNYNAHLNRKCVIIFSLSFQLTLKMI